MNQLSYQDVVDILNLLKETAHCASLDLEIGDLKLSVKRRATGAVELAVPTSSVSNPPAEAARASPPPGSGMQERDAGKRGEFVRAPLLGTYYRALEPGAPPCVKVGDIVSPEDVVGLIEVMKLYTQVTADVQGRVVEVLVENAVLVEHNQPLFRVEPL